MTLHRKNNPEAPSTSSSGEVVRLGRPRLLREVNARRILHLLRQHGPCSRADLVRYSGLSAPTISSTVVHLQKNDLIEAVGPGPSGGGRPPDLLRFNTRAGYVVGVDIGAALVRIALADMGGNIVEKHVFATHLHSAPDDVISLIATGIRKLQSHHRIPSKKLLALAAGVPGITNVREGVVLSAPLLSSLWRSVPLKKILEDKTGMPATVENDVNLAAMGEGWCGAARGARNFVFLTIGTGIGAGIFINGHLYHGADWAAGEIGYLYVPGTEETPLDILRPGSLEAVIGAKGIERTWQRLCSKNPQEAHRVARGMGAEEMLDLAEQGEPLANEILQHAARILADAITNLCVVLNPSLVILGGRIGSRPALFKATCQIIGRNEFCRPQLVISSLASDAPLMGSIRLALGMAERQILPEGDALGLDGTILPAPAVQGRA